MTFCLRSRTAHQPKGLSCRYLRDLIVCAKALPARMTAGLSHGMPGHGAGICSGPISGSTMHNAGSTPSRLGGGARTATRSWMICGEDSTGYVPYHCSRINPRIRTPFRRSSHTGLPSGSDPACWWKNGLATSWSPSATRGSG